MTQDSDPDGPVSPTPPAGDGVSSRPPQDVGRAAPSGNLADDIVAGVAPFNTPPTADTQRLLAGRYKLEGLLGRGSMGAVWRAHDVVLRRSVAVKEVLLPPTQTEEDNAIARERALREARAIAALSHPNVVTLYDVVEEDGRPWVVMELVPAKSLAEVLRDDGPLSPSEAARIGLAVLGALDAAHQVGITHRDVKPGNILVSGDGRVKLADFGISRKVDESQLTRTGLMVGSPSYIAPEVARGKEAGRPADIWGLGATLHCAVEGSPPFDLGDPVATLTAVVGEAPRPAPHAGPLGPVIARTLDKDPRQRIQADELRRQLADIASRPSDRSSTQPVAPARPLPPQNAARPLPPQAVARAVHQPTPPGPPPTMRPPVRPGTPPPSSRTMVFPRQPPPARGPVTAPPVARRPMATGPVPTRPQRNNSLTWLAAVIAILLIVGAVVTVVLVNQNTDGNQGQGTGSSTPPTSVTTTAGATGAAEPIELTVGTDGTIAGGIQVGDLGWFGFTLQAPVGWKAVQPEPTRVDLAPPLAGATGDTRMTVVANQLTAASVGDQLTSQFKEDGSPAALDDYESIVFEPTGEGDALNWEYTYTDDGEDMHGFTYAVVKGNVLWRVIFSAQENRKNQLAKLYKTTVASFQI